MSKDKQDKLKQTHSPSSHKKREPVEHGVEVVGWDNLGGGWWLQCLCGWDTIGSQLMETTGEAFDDHLRECGVLKEI